MRESSFPLYPNFAKVEKRRFEYYNISVTNRRKRKMKKSTLDKIVELIGNEEMDSEDVRKVMNVIRKQDEVVGNIVVCRDALIDIASVCANLVYDMSEKEAEERAYDVLVAMDIDGCIASASERFWDSVIDEIDDAAFEALNG